MADFKIGDVVTLKSGSPEMTVSKIFGDGDVQCVWFVGEKPEAYLFHKDALE